MAILGVIILVVGIILCFTQRRLGNRIAVIEATPRSRVKEVTAQLVGRTIELQGRVRCATPLISPLAKQACAHYTMRVVREYDRPATNASRSTGTETMAEETRSISFEIEDDSGTMTVNPEQAQFELRPGINRFDRDGGRYAIADTGGVLGAFFGNRQRTRGYRFTESFLAIDGVVYILGELAQENGRLILTAPRAQNGQFLIADRAEDKLLSDLRTSVNIQLILAWLCTSIGLVLLFWPLVARISQQ